MTMLLPHEKRTITHMNKELNHLQTITLYLLPHGTTVFSLLGHTNILAGRPALSVYCSPSQNIQDSPLKISSKQPQTQPTEVLGLSFSQAAKQPRSQGHA